LVDRRLRQLGIFFERIGKARGGLVGELLAHLRHALVVYSDGLRIEARLGGAERACRGDRGDRAEAKEWSQLLAQSLSPQKIRGDENHPVYASAGAKSRTLSRFAGDDRQFILSL